MFAIFFLKFRNSIFHVNYFNFARKINNKNVSNSRSRAYVIK